jgi:hypothetical protein
VLWNKNKNGGKRGRPRKFTAPPKGHFECQECKDEGIKKVFKFAKALGSHRQRAHGVVGTSAAVVNKRNAQERAHSNGSSNGAGTSHDEAIAFWTGTITASFTSEVQAIAERIGVSGEELAARCVAILSDKSKTLRGRYRLSHRL